VADETAAWKTGRNLKDVVRYVLGVIVGIVVLALLVGKRAEFSAATRELGHLDIGWLVAAVSAEAASLWSFAYLQHWILRLAGTRIGTTALFPIALANDAIANTVPGEPAISSAYRYRLYRRRGATPASAGWSIFTTLISLALAMSLLLLLGVIVALAGSTTASSAGAAILGLIIVVLAGAILIRRDLVLRLAGALVRACRRVTGHPRGNIGARIDGTLARMREIPLSARSTVGVVTIAAAVWFCDFLCLACSFGAVHAVVPWYGVLLAYGVAQVLGTLPIIPGGLGIVEGSLAVILIAYGASRASALSVALAYRLVSFWLSIAVGWVVVALIAQHGRRRAQADLAASTEELVI
jgi:putative heme transporter